MCVYFPPHEVVGLQKLFSDSTLRLCCSKAPSSGIHSHWLPGRHILMPRFAADPGPGTVPDWVGTQPCPRSLKGPGGSHEGNRKRNIERQRTIPWQESSSFQTRHTSPSSSKNPPWRGQSSGRFWRSKRSAGMDVMPSMFWSRAWAMFPISRFPEQVATKCAVDTETIWNRTRSTATCHSKLCGLVWNRKTVLKTRKKKKKSIFTGYPQSIANCGTWQSARNACHLKASLRWTQLDTSGKDPL